MKDFNDIRNLWSDNQTTSPLSFDSLANRKKDQIGFFKRQYKLSALGLFSVTIFILWFAFGSDRNFIFELSYAALALISICLFIMVLINLHNVFLISKIDETIAPKEYLNRWFKFYRNRFQFFRIYGPTLFLSLLVSFALYIPEILGYYPNTPYKIGFVIFIFVFFIIYLKLGKKAVREEKMKLNELNNTIRMLFEE
jgi:hypothetical protein